MLLFVAAAVGVWLWADTFEPHISSRSQIPLTPGAVHHRFFAHLYGGDFEVRAVVLQPDAYQLQLVDHADRRKPMPNFTGHIVAINGGYFREDFSPAGLYMLEGKQLSPLSPHAPLSAIVGTNAAGRLQLLARDAPFDQLRSAMQAGPFLIDPGGRRGIRSKDGPRAKRTVVALSTAAEVIVMTTEDASLYEVARVLEKAPKALGTQPIERAINLDGGPSTAFLTPGLIPVMPTGPVRNYLVFSPAQ